MHSKNLRFVLALLTTFATFPGSMARAAAVPESIRSQLVEKGEEKETTVEPVFEIASPTRKDMVYAAYVVSHVEEGQVVDSNYALFQLSAGAPVFLLRDTSLVSVRSATHGKLPEKDLQAILLEFGKRSMRNAGGKNEYAAYAKERAKSGGMSADEKWLFTQLLGKDFAK